MHKSLVPVNMMLIISVKLQFSIQFFVFTSSDIEPHLLSRPTNVPIECLLIPQDIGPSIVSTLVD